MARPRNRDGDLDLELEDLPAPARWREWMGRVEAVIFASAEPVFRENLARVVGKACNLDLIIDDIREELGGRPYELVSVAGGWSFRTKLGFGDAIRTAIGGPQKTELSRSNALVLMAIAYFQPITRGELSQFLGREVSRDTIASLRGEGLIAAGPRSPTPGAPYAYVTTLGFLSHFGFESLRDLPDIEKLEDAGLLGRTSGDRLNGAGLDSELRGDLGLNSGDDQPEEDAAR
jgi:segregation and condensation protein B